MDLFDLRAASPMLIGVSEDAFDSDDYIYELKLDGERGLMYVDGKTMELRNKRQVKMLPKFPELGSAVNQVQERCILDGEFITTIDGKPDFSEVKRRSLMSDTFKIKLAADKWPVSFVAYDILYYKHESLLHLPLMERKNILQEAVSEGDLLSVSRYIEREGRKLFALTKQQGLEGIVAKKKDSLYYCGKRTKEWIKCKNMLDDDYVICGYIGKSESVTSLVLGKYVNGILSYRGHVTLGISRYDFSLVSALPKTGTSPFAVLPKGNENAVWVVPDLVCTVEYMEKSESGFLRHAIYKGLRTDKDPYECVE